MSILGLSSPPLRLTLWWPPLSSHCSRRVIPCEHPENWAEQGAGRPTFRSCGRDLANEKVRQNGLQFSSGREAAGASWRGGGRGGKRFEASTQRQTEKKLKMRAKIKSLTLISSSDGSKSYIKTQKRLEGEERAAGWVSGRGASHDCTCLQRHSKLYNQGNLKFSCNNTQPNAESPSTYAF